MNTIIQGQLTDDCCCNLHALVRMNILKMKKQPKGRSFSADGHWNPHHVKRESSDVKNGNTANVLN